LLEYDAERPLMSDAASLLPSGPEGEPMRSRDALIRLKKYQVDEKRRKVAQIEGMIVDFEASASTSNKRSRPNRTTWH
jgi:hypothetical protein